jgi:hypothetical protein
MLLLGAQTLSDGFGENKITHTCNRSSHSKNGNGDAHPNGIGKQTRRCTRQAEHESNNGKVTGKYAPAQRIG